MQWSPRGAHLLLPTRTKVFNDELEDTFRQWYPAFRPASRSEAARGTRSVAPGNLRSPLSYGGRLALATDETVMWKFGVPVPPQLQPLYFERGSQVRPPIATLEDGHG